MKKALYVLDAYSIIYKSYFAFMRNPLVNKNGRNISAAFGFFRTLFRIFNEYKPEYFAAAMDSMTPTFRHIEYPEYKANRDKTPDDLRDNIPLVEEILNALKIPILRCDGFEADDIMATLAKQSADDGWECYVISGDKDLLQLVEGDNKIIRQDKQGFSIYERDRVFEEWNVYPEQILDYLSMVGDQADNIPGVAGIGPKTAATLLGKYRTLDGIYENIEKTSAGQKKKLAADKEKAYLSKDLIALRYDVPVGKSLDELKREDFYSPGFEEHRKLAVDIFFREGMKSLAGELDSEVADDSEKDAPLAEYKKGVYEAVTQVERLDYWVEKVKEAGVFAFDVETDNIDEIQANPVGFSISTAREEACYIPVKVVGIECIPEDIIREKLRPILEDPDLKLVGQNFKYDFKVLHKWGIEVRNVWFDTMLAAWLLDSAANTFGMDVLAERYLHYKTISFKDIVPKGETFDTVILDVAKDYAAEDADITFRLYEMFSKQLKDEGLEELFFTLEMPLLTLLAEMELRGIALDGDNLKTYSSELARKLAGLQDDIYMLCGKQFNINSTKQLQVVLFTDRQLTPIKKTKTGFSTDTSVLEALAKEDPVPEKILAHRGLAKLKSTYVDTLPELIDPLKGRIHTHYLQTGTATGRIASKDPNLQNIPIRTEEGRKIRGAFKAAPGKVFVSADYSQIELVVLAHLSEDPGLCEAFTEGKDVHRKTASLIFHVDEEEVSADQRRIAKSINFGIMYGMSAFRLSNDLGIPRSEASHFIKTYFERYKKIQEFIDATVENTEKTGYSYTMLGHRRQIDRINSKNKTEKMGAERVAVNTPIQGSAADIVKLAMIKVSKRLADEDFDAQLLLQVHDELIFEVAEDSAHKAAAVIREVMESVVELKVPLRVNVEIGKDWGELH